MNDSDTGMCCRGFAVVDSGGEPQFWDDLSRDKQSRSNRGERVQSESDLGCRKERLLKMRYARCCATRPAPNVRATLS